MWLKGLAKNRISIQWRHAITDSVEFTDSSAKGFLLIYALPLLLPLLVPRYSAHTENGLCCMCLILLLFFMRNARFS